MNIDEIDKQGLLFLFKTLSTIIGLTILVISVIYYGRTGIEKINCSNFGKDKHVSTYYVYGAGCLVDTPDGMVNLQNFYSSNSVLTLKVK